MVHVLRAMTAPLVAAPGMDTATPRAHVAVVVPGLLAHLEAPSPQGSRFSVVEAARTSVGGTADVERDVP
jgi:hypothetical protein